MKALLKIVLGGFAAFMVLAIFQERAYFASTWFGRADLPAEFSEADRKAAADTVYLTLKLMGHLYSSGGDPRFAERMPADQHVIDEMLADIRYLASNHRRQIPELEQMEVTSITPVGERRLELRTRERWNVSWVWIADGSESDRPWRQTVRGRFAVRRVDGEWRVEDWEVLDAPATAKDGSS